MRACKASDRLLLRPKLPTAARTTQKLTAVLTADSRYCLTPSGITRLNGDDDFPLAFPVGVQPAGKVGLTGHGNGLGNIQGTHAPPAEHW